MKLYKHRCYWKNLNRQPQVIWLLALLHLFELQLLSQKGYNQLHVPTSESQIQGLKLTIKVIFGNRAGFRFSSWPHGASSSTSSHVLGSDAGPQCRGLPGSPRPQTPRQSHRTAHGGPWWGAQRAGHSDYNQLRIVSFCFLHLIESPNSKITGQQRWMKQTANIRHHFKSNCLDKPLIEFPSLQLWKWRRQVTMETNSLFKERQPPLLI